MNFIHNRHLLRVVTGPGMRPYFHVSARCAQPDVAGKLSHHLPFMPCPEYLFIDLDETVIMHDTAFCDGLRATDNLNARLLELNINTRSHSQLRSLMADQYYNAPIRFVEERWNTLVRELKHAGVKVFGLTSNCVHSPYTRDVLAFLRQQNFAFTHSVSLRRKQIADNLGDVLTDDDVGTIIFGREGESSDKGKLLLSFLQNAYGLRISPPQQ